MGGLRPSRLAAGQHPGRPIGFLSDVHGNLEALQAVLAEFEAQRIQRVVALGDLLLGGPAPLEVWRRLQRAHATCIAGVGELALARVEPERLQARTPEERARIEQFVHTRRALGELVRHQLRQLPMRLEMPAPGGGTLLAVHGSPADPTEPITHDMEERKLRALLGPHPPRYVVCGASHVPFERTVDDTQIVSVGSVGEPPGGGRVAHYAIAWSEPGGLRFELGWVRY